jgi:hypothetical protein
MARQQRLKRKQAASARFAARARRAFRAFLTERVPFPAGLAFSLPAAERSAAVLADEGQVAFRHWESLGIVVRQANSPERTIQEHF